jgi:hypothetical protein
MRCDPVMRAERSGWMVRPEFQGRRIVETAMRMLL